MGRGRKLSDETIQDIKVTFGLTGSIADTARTLRLPESTVRDYTNQANRDEFAAVRAEKVAEAIPDIVARGKQVQLALLDALMDKDKIKAADYRDIGVNFGIVTDKMQLLTGEPTERHEHRDISEARDEFARRIDELAERRRARGADLGVRTG